MRQLSLLRLGVKDYQEVREQQKQLQAELIKGGEKDYLISCSHPEVITYGRNADLDNILDSSNIPKYQVERGGDVTYHGPEQSILYPIINLNNHKRDVSWYLRQLEQVVINCLQELGLKSVRIEGKSGVWIDENKKIASLGVRISRWCTMHGIALNVLETINFELIVPCGLKSVQMTSLQEELDEIEQYTVEDLLIRSFCNVFNYESLDS